MYGPGDNRRVGNLKSGKWRKITLLQNKCVLIWPWKEMKSAAKYSQERATFRNDLQANLHGRNVNVYDKSGPVTTAWCDLWLRMEERPPIWRVAANILNKQSRTADKGWPSSSGVRRVANNSSPWKSILLQTIHKSLDTCECGNEPSGSI
jgi:hypothetical protein